MKRVVVGILSRQRGDEPEYFLVSSTKDFGEFSGAYYPPGGHIEEGEDEPSALIREIHEELGVDIAPIRCIAETLGDVKDQITYWWECELLNNDFVIDIQELADTGWFTRKEMENLPLWPATRKFFNEHIFKE